MAIAPASARLNNGWGKAAAADTAAAAAAEGGVPFQGLEEGETIDDFAEDYVIPVQPVRQGPAAHAQATHKPQHTT